MTKTLVFNGIRYTTNSIDHKTISKNLFVVDFSGQIYVFILFIYLFYNGFLELWVFYNFNQF